MNDDHQTIAALRQRIEEGYEQRSSVTPESVQIASDVETVLDMLDKGAVRVAEKREGEWRVQTWLKKAVLLSFRTRQNTVMSDGLTHYFDKLPLKYANYDKDHFDQDGVRIVPQALVRYGAHVAKDVVLMPCYINLGAYIGSGSMIDTWATIGSCAQVGKDVHISGGVGIGGVLEPLQATPTIIEDHCFIGARSEIVEGVIVETGAVIAMGVFIGASTRIYERETGEITFGRIPAGAVVVPGSLPSEDGRYNLNCAVIVKRVDEKTRRKVGINSLLRNID